MAEPVNPPPRRVVPPPGGDRAVPAPAPAPTRKRWDEIPSGSMFAGRYQIERLLARGGMSGVYLAQQNPLNRPVALKVLVPIVEDAEGEASFQERFRLEARTLAALNHPNIVVVYDYGETEDGEFYLAMEFIDGPRLSDVLKAAGRMPVQRALKLVVQVCAALRYAHARGVIHRDIKLSNIMLWNDGERQDQVKVVDFGLVKLTETDQRLTSAGMVLGSPHFMAPEQARGQDVDHRADIYATGILLFCLLTGAAPYTGTSATATILAHLTQPIPTLAGAVPDGGFTPQLEAVIQRALAKKAEDRYADMDAFIADLTSLMDGSYPSAVRVDGLASQIASVPSSATLVTYNTGATPPAVEKREWLAFAAVALGALILVGSALALGVLGLFSDDGGQAASGGAQPAPVVEVKASGPSIAPPASATEAPPTPAPGASRSGGARNPGSKAGTRATGGSAEKAAPASGASAGTSSEASSGAPEASAPAAGPAQPAKTGEEQQGKSTEWRQSELKDPWDD